MWLYMKVILKCVDSGYKGGGIRVGEEEEDDEVAEILLNLDFSCGNRRQEQECRGRC